MSDLNYFIVAKTMHKQPRIVFLRKNQKWALTIKFKSTYDYSNTFAISDARIAAKNQPTHCAFIEATDGLLYALSDIFEHQNFISAVDFEALITNLHCKRESTLVIEQAESANETPEAESELQVVPRSFIVSEMTIKGKGEPKPIEIWDTPQETPAPEAKKRVVYVLCSRGDEGRLHYSHYESNSIFVRVKGKIADAYRTPEDAQFAADILNNNGDTNFGWIVQSVDLD